MQITQIACKDHWVQWRFKTIDMDGQDNARLK